MDGVCFNLRDSITSQARPKLTWLTRQPHFCNVVIICCHIFVVTCVTLLSWIIKYMSRPRAAGHIWLVTHTTHNGTTCATCCRNKLSRRYKPSNEPIRRLARLRYRQRETIFSLLPRKMSWQQTVSTDAPRHMSWQQI